MGAFARPPIFSPPLAPHQPHSPSLIIGCSSSRLCRAHPQQGRPDDDGRAADGRDYPARPRCAPLQHTHSRRTHTHLFIKPTSCSRHSPPQGRCPTRSSRSCCRKSGGLPRRSRERTVSCHVGLVRVAGFGGETLWSEQHRVCRPVWSLYCLFEYIWLCVILCEFRSGSRWP